MNDEDKKLLLEAARMVITVQYAAQTSLQRRMRVRFATAERLLNRLTDLGILGPAQGSVPRDVLYRYGQLDEALARVSAAFNH